VIAKSTAVPKSPSRTWTLVTALFVLLTLYGVWQLNRLNRSIALAPFIERQTELYTEVSRTASFIANSTDTEAVERASEHFLTLMNGPLVIYSDEISSWSVALFATCMTEPGNQKCKDRDLKQLATSLGKTMRMSLSETGRLGLINLPARVPN